VRRVAFLAVVLVAAVAFSAGAAAGAEQATLEAIEDEVVCPTCNTTLAVSRSPIAERMRAFIRARIAAGDTKSEIKAKLVDEFGEGVLAAPPARGFNLLAWVLPLAGALSAAIVLVLLARRWLPARSERERPGARGSLDGRGALDPELERRVDEELARFEA
jgi:cytochrome c-type biogenesis protein CcmH